MANKDLLLKPKWPRDKSWWWYEISGGISVHVPAKPGLSAKGVVIPWRSLRAALARKDKGARDG